MAHSINALTEFAFDYVLGAVAAGTTDQDSAVVDLSGWDGVLFVGMLGDVTSTSVLQLVTYGNTASSTSSPTPVAITGGATVAYTASTSDADSTAMIVDVIRPSKRYAFARIKRGTANAVVNGILAIRYRGKTAPPITQGATILASITSTPEV